MRLLAQLLLVLLFALPVAAQAQVTLPSSTTTKDAPKPDPAKLRELKSTLEDPAARQKLIDQIDLLAQASDKQGDNDDQPDLLENAGERVLRFVSVHIANASAALVEAAAAVSRLPQAERWFERQMADPDVRERWSLLFAALAAIVLFGAVASIVVRRALTRPLRALERRGVDKPFGTRLSLGLARFLLELGPVVVFGLVGYAVASAIAPPDTVRLAALTIVNASLLLFSLLALVRLVLQPAAPGLRLVRLDDETSNYLYIWLRRLFAIAVYGWFFIAAARLLGLWRSLAETALKFVGLTLAVLLVVVILQNRRSMAAWLRGSTDPEQTSAFWSVRRRFAEVWHLLAIAYVAIVWFIYAVNLTGGFAFVAKASLLTLVVAVVARLVTAGIDRAFEHGFAVSADLRAQFPGLEARANRYIPLLRRLIVLALWFIAALTILRAWGLDSWHWFETDSGRALLGKLGAILFILALSIAAWEFVASGIERYLTGGGNGVVIRSARTRTLLPLLRNVFLIFLLVITSTVILGELGINTAPLLAGAGVIGLAIGFGAQTLVKDVINGAFILFDNTIAVGDVVDLDKGRSGLVEAMSIRALKLRDGTGAVYTVPFGDVTSVKNMARDFSFYVFDIAVAYDQDPDAVIDALRDLAAEIQTEPAYAGDVIDPLEVIGVNAFTDKAVMVQARLKTRPNKQWGVGRELNRRMKKKFEELGITSPYVTRDIKVTLDEETRAALRARATDKG
ncbi:mechanosensitive ion channel domain-containing protein [Roseiterribacter gracilis]|uniref:Mechanosensitive ion channel protein MscS n=1 Tax=Roseiterribacter gracilis TaxID=2812848 RepID=A0A8S8X7G2_9PROT|nr:mechanosensitive ion channel protein MscS [Rhodospirillales bacterium TMPK1]